MKKVIILFGGRSAEHEVSLQSAKNILDAIDKEKFTPILVGIDKDGKWLLQNTSDFLINQDDPKNIKLNPNGAPCVMSFGGKIMNLRTGQDFPFDVVFPILHGPFGEDGTVQGLLKINQVPFVGTGVLGSAVGMDKDMAKRLLRDSGIPTSRFIVLRDFEAVPPYKDITAKLGSPIFVKPANMGSSVGVNKIETETEYINFVREAFNYDSKIILEEYINGREIECAVLGNDEVISSIPGEIKSTHSFYSYDAKYIDENGAVTEIPAKLSPEKIKETQELAIKTFKVLCCEGLSRVDFFIKADGSIFVNEINTMPGFTKISMYPKLFEACGITYTELITRLIDLAFSRFEKEKTLKTSYNF